jgi:hypothetical protein
MNIIPAVLPAAHDGHVWALTLIGTSFDFQFSASSYYLGTEHTGVP